MTTPKLGQFATVFRSAVAASGMTLSQIVDAMADEGVKVTQATLSYWQSGRSAPRRQSSLDSIDVLEQVLGTTPGTLSRVLAEDRGAQKSMMYHSSHMLGNSSLEEFGIDPRTEPVTVVLRDDSIIAEDARTSSAITDKTVRIMADDATTMHIIDTWDKGDEAMSVRDVRFARLGEAVLGGDGSLRMTPLEMPSSLKRGDLYRVEYSCGFSHPKRVVDTLRRWFAQPVVFYSSSVHFLGIQPAVIQAVEVRVREMRTSGRRSISEQPKPVELVDGYAQYTVLDPSVAAFYFRWYW
ncbi:hypothetical protein [Neoactinobaculum massilliense]|uniref:hypothetical protein n=1 Tax=Neoactinobaculum massilliense TaxID=2364794 RepID=UPI000F53EA69|nr:hypothetical protein [Neoactinobaculum massilliense]